MRRLGNLRQVFALGAGIVVLVLGCRQTARAQCTNPVGPAVVSYPTGTAPEAVAVGDFNGDGKLDLVVANTGADSVSVLLNKGDGTFQPAKTTAGILAPGGLAVGDFNHDGKLDLAVANSGNSGTVSVMLGNGDGTFGAPTTYAIGVQSISIVTADFNGDGNLDLAVAIQPIGAPSGSVTVLLGQGNGQFQYGSSYYNIPIAGVNSLAAGDFNGDGRPDLVVASNGPTVSVLLSTGLGNFQVTSVQAVTGESFAVTVADFNHDGKLDLAVSDITHSTVDILLGNGNGTFGSPASFPSGGVGPDSLAVSDFNGDGNLDLLVANFGYPATVGLLFGDGSGRFPCEASVFVLSQSPVGGDFISLAVGDFNGDAKPDVAIVDPAGNNVDVLLNNSAGSSAGCATYQPAVNYSLPLAPNVRDLVTGDFNGDGKLDLVVGSANNSANLSVLFGNGDGTFQPANSYPAPQVQSLATGDFNGDGKLDLAIANYTPGSVEVLLGNGTGTIPSFGFTSYATGPGADFVAVADLNHDNKLDLVVANEAANTVSVLLGNGDGTFQPAQSFAVGSEPRAVAVGDFNGDGNPDLAVANPAGGGSISILLGNGSGTFLPATSVNAGPFPYWVVAADFNGDGKLDLAAANANSGSISVMLGNGDGTFQAPVPYPSPNPYSMKAVDVNGDGRPDLIVTSYSPTSTVSVLVGNGDGTFQAAVSYATDSVPLSVAITDFNGDGKPDLATANEGGNSVSVLLHSSCQAPPPGNTPAGSNISVQPVDTTTSTSPITLTFSDVTQAGNTTLTTNSSGPTLPSGFASGAVPIFYSLTTTAVYTGSIEICINYAGSSFYSNQLSIWHYTGGSWTQLSTFSGGPTTLCASTSSLSPFAILQPADTTPPVIAPSVTGTLGQNGWYVSSVSVSWNVTDPESGIASSTGCGPVTLSVNTAGTTLTCSATDGAGLSNSVSVTVKIDQSPPNPPTAALNPAPNGAGWNNSSTIASFASNGDVGPSGVASCTAPISVTGETAGTVVSGVCVGIAGKQSSATVATVKIDETAPVVSNVLANPDPVAINTGTTLSAAVTDPGAVVSGVASAQFNINGGPFSAMTGTFSQAAVNVTAAVPPFKAAGVYTVCVSGADVAGNASGAACIPLAVYDPTGGFVTGGGSISSPAGADLANPSASGPATFGFVSKYLPGANTPSGNLQFHFSSGNLHFQSTSMDWLVVTGEPRAQFHGTGTINGGATCQFQVDAWGNSFQPGNLNAFGIKIYSCSNGSDRYSVPATPLNSGSIIIHRQ